MSRRAPIWESGSRPIAELACRGMELGLLKVTRSGYSTNSSPKDSMLDIVAKSLLRFWQNKTAMGLLDHDLSAQGGAALCRNLPPNRPRASIF
jgi:hypothetical protein